jgi:hypothetical protein
MRISAARRVAAGRGGGCDSADTSGIRASKGGRVDISSRSVGSPISDQGRWLRPRSWGSVVVAE